PDAAGQHLPRYGGGAARSRRRAEPRAAPLHVRARRRSLRCAADADDRLRLRQRDRRPRPSADPAGRHRTRPCLCGAAEPGPVDGEARVGTVFYVGYNLTEGGTWTLAQRTLKAAKAKRLRAVVVDLRNNPGGDSHTYVDLLDALVRVAKTKRVVVIISRTTFSAAENFAADLERLVHPVFVGEPSGGSPNLYGDATVTSLPASGLTLHVATIYWQKSFADDPRVTIAPPVAVPLASTDFFAGRDPVLSAGVGAGLAPKRLAAVGPQFSYDRSRPLNLRFGVAETR